MCNCNQYFMNPRAVDQGCSACRPNAAHRLPYRLGNLAPGEQWQLTWPPFPLLNSQTARPVWLTGADPHPLPYLHGLATPPSSAGLGCPSPPSVWQDTAHHAHSRHQIETTSWIWPMDRLRSVHLTHWGNRLSTTAVND